MRISTRVQRQARFLAAMLGAATAVEQAAEEVSFAFSRHPLAAEAAVILRRLAARLKEAAEKVLRSVKSDHRG